MGPKGEKTFEDMYKIYSEKNNITFEEFWDKIVLDPYDKNKEIFDELYEKVKNKND